MARIMGVCLLPSPAASVCSSSRHIGTAIENARASFRATFEVSTAYQFSFRGREEFRGHQRPKSKWKTGLHSGTIKKSRFRAVRSATDFFVRMIAFSGRGLGLKRFRCLDLRPIAFCHASLFSTTYALPLGVSMYMTRVPPALDSSIIPSSTSRSA